jgi:hypothetical protein
MKNLKGWRTLGFNLLIILLPITVTYLAGVNWSDYLSPTWALIITGAANLGLRVVTTGPIGEK